MNTAMRVPVLMYHRVGMANNPWEARYAIRPNDFVAHMESHAKVKLKGEPRLVLTTTETA